MNAAQLAAAPKTDPRIAAIVRNAGHSSSLRRAGIHVTFRADECGGRVVFSGGKFGSHSVSADDAVRVVVHLEGYLEANGLDPMLTEGAAFYFHGNGNPGNARIYMVARVGSRGAIYTRSVFKSGRMSGETYHDSANRKAQCGRKGC